VHKRRQIEESIFQHLFLDRFIGMAGAFGWINHSLPIQVSDVVLVEQHPSALVRRLCAHGCIERELHLSDCLRQCR